MIARSLISTGFGADSPESKKSSGNVVHAATNGVWVDPESRFTWATKVSGYPVTQKMAVEYCKNLRTANYK